MFVEAECAVGRMRIESDLHDAAAGEYGRKKSLLHSDYA